MSTETLKLKVVKRMIKFSKTFAEECQEFSWLHVNISNLNNKKIYHGALTKMKKEKALMKITLHNQINLAKRDFDGWLDSLEDITVT